MKNVLRASALLVALTVAGAACASDDPETTDDGATTVDAGDDTATTVDGDAMEDGDKDKEGDAMEDGDKDAAAEEPATVAAIVIDSEDHTILEQALAKAELVETLEGDGPFTVFAPTDAAFEAYLAEADIEAADLLASEDLAKILTGHVVAGPAIKAEAITETAQELDTVAETKIEAVITDGKATVGGAEVSTPDVVAGNGIVHVIDSVILPAAE